jgi:hypothetical protein
MKQRIERAFLFTPPPPLKDIETIPWQKIQGVYGTAEHIPLLLHQLLSPDSQKQKHALTELDNALMHTYASEAAIYAVPFLLRLLLEPAVQVKAGILELLQLIACPVPKSMHKALMVAQTARSKSAAGFPIYLTLLAHTDPVVRLWASSVLICFPEQARAIRPALSAAFRQEDDPQARANLVQALATISSPKRWQWFFHLSRTENQEFVAFIALNSIPLLAHEDTPEAVIEQLAAYLLRPPSSLEAFVPRSHIRYTCMRSLFHLKKERLQFLVPWLMGQCEDPDKEIYHLSYPEKLLELLFDKRTDQQNVADLTEQQKATLFLLWRREDLWKSGNFVLLLKSYGLPKKREELAVYLGEL